MASAWKKERAEIEALIPASWYPRSTLKNRIQHMRDYAMGLLELNKTMVDRLEFETNRADSAELTSDALTRSKHDDDDRPEEPPFDTRIGDDAPVDDDDARYQAFLDGYGYDRMFD